MINPWLKIPHFVYENHMSEVGQAQIFSELTKLNLDIYKPKSFALIGCSTGNGLEHIEKTITKNIYAIDINPDYIEQTYKRFIREVENLKTYCIDIQKNEFEFSNIDLVFVGLVLEYVEPKKTIEKIIRTLYKKGILVLVIQKSKQTSFVSKTKYKSLENLSQISKIINEVELDKFIRQKEMALVERKAIEMTMNKSLIALTYKNRNC